MGLMNSLGIFQAYLENHELKNYSSGKIGWILGLYTFLAFFCGIQIGPVFDARGPRILVICGGIGTVSLLVLLSFCTAYWQFMVIFGVLGGISLALAFSPSISIVAHYFHQHRGLATGIASSGASFGGVIFPLLFQNVVSPIEFAWAIRVIGLVEFIAFAATVLLIRPRRPPNGTTAKAVLLDLSIFCDGALMLASMGIFFHGMGLICSNHLFDLLCFTPWYSIPVCLSIVIFDEYRSNFRRCIPGYCADRIGRFNTLIITVFGCLLCTACLWIPANASKPVITLFALLFGFTSGSNVSLAPVCIGQLCKLEAYGRGYATAYAVVSIRCVCRYCLNLF
jgi:MFS family permease